MAMWSVSIEEGFIHSFIETFIERLPYTKNGLGARARIPALMKFTFWGTIKGK